MPLPIEHYGMIGDTQTAGLVGRNGSIDWLCLPRFDSGACFAALLGDDEHGHWQIAPSAAARHVRRRYRGNTLILETEFETDDGVVRLIDCMPPRMGDPDVVRVVEGVSGRVRMGMELIIRFDYGHVVPWARRDDGRLRAIAGPDAAVLDTPVEIKGQGLTTTAAFSVGAGERVPFVLRWHASHLEPGSPADAFAAVGETEDWWEAWSRRQRYDGDWADAVMRSLITLKALTYQPTGGIVASPTTSLPEMIGGVRNWDYRMCWLRDASMTLDALLICGYTEEAVAWRDWLLRAVAGSPDDLQIMYGCAGERWLQERTLDWLPGYEGSTPVRVGNAASEQIQLDVYGEVMELMSEARRNGLGREPHPAWPLQRSMMEHLESTWDRPDWGIWEIRGEPQHFTHSKVMAWVAADRAVQAVERSGLDGPSDRWKELRDTIHAEVCDRAWDAERSTFTQFYGSQGLDAALLLIPMVGFLPADDERVRGTVAAIERELLEDGFVRRYSHGDDDVDGLPYGEGAFLACTFWLADNYALVGRSDEAVKLFERLLDLRNDVGLLSEEWDVTRGRMVGNFPKAFSHVPLINTARYLSHGTGPAQQRGRDAW